MASDVLYVLRYFPTLTETFVYREIESLLERGVSVRIAALGTRADGLRADGLPLVPVRWKARGGRLLVRMLRHRCTKNPARLADWVGWARGVDRVHVHFAGEAAVWGRAVADALGVPCSVTVHAADLFKPRPGLGSLLASVEVLTVCAHHQRWMADRYGVASTVVRCGVRVRGRARAQPAREPARIVSVARDVPKKGLDRLVRAVSGRHALRMVSDTALRGPGVETGWAAPSEIPQLLARAQLFALPAMVARDGDRDGIPVSMMEAMAAGLPVVTRPVAGIPELVDDSVGWIDTNFEAALEQALSAPEERRRRGEQARQRITSGWTLEHSVDALVAAWARVRP